MNDSTKFLLLLCLTTIIALINSCEKEDDNKPLTVMDIEGNIFHTITIGTQVWMAENLKTTKLNDGSGITLIIDNSQWSNSASSAYCWYNNDESSNKPEFGALYNYYSVSSGKLCPLGWHVPTDSEWETLIEFLGGSSIAGAKLKQTGTIHWLAPNTDATNEFGFNALPAGDRFADGTFHYLGRDADWWSSTEEDLNNAIYHNVTYENSDVLRVKYSKNGGMSVRCLKD